MANNDLEFQIIYKLDRAEKQLDTLIANTNKKGQQGFSRAGADIGAIFGRQLTYFAVRSIGIGLIVQAVQAAFQFGIQGLQSALAQERAASSLQFNIESINRTNQKRYEILNDGTKSIEEQATALGYTTDQIYEETTATQGSTNATKGLEGQIQRLNRELKNKERALEDSLKSQKNELDSLEEVVSIRKDEVDAINRQLQAIKAQNDERVKAARIAAGYGNLQREKEQLKLQESQLRLQISERLLSGGYIFDLQQQLKILNEQQNLNDAKIDIVDSQIKLTEQQTDAQEEQLKAEKLGIENVINDLELKANIIKRAISRAENKYELDTEPAKRQIEDLQERINSIQLSFKGGGSTKKIKQSIIDDINRSKLIKPELLNAGDYQKLVDNLFEKFGGLVSRGDLTQGINDLTQAGITDVNQLSDVIIRFQDIATNKSPTLNFGEALKQLSEQFRNTRGALGETAGLTQEYATDIIPAGIQAIENLRLKQKQNAAALTEQEKNTLALFAGTEKLTKDGLTPAQEAQAKYYGLLDITNNRQGIFERLLGEGKLGLDQMQASLAQLANSIGNELVPAVLTLLYGPDKKPGGAGGLIDLVNYLNYSMGGSKRKSPLADILKDMGETFNNLGKNIEETTKFLKMFFDIATGKSSIPSEFIPSSLKDAIKQAFPLAKSIPGFANGADFIVPPGFPNDTFPLRVQSGERVQVTPSNQINTTNNNNTTYNMWGNGNYNQPTPTSIIYR